ncbi:GH36-type glycosyl hydrolase domain-containing protein [Candidatus Margulisiibacteriota bacterium]
MKFGYFDNEHKEYVITNPRTPTPWINYIGEGNYGGIVSNSGGGFSFDGDPKNKRVTRYRYNMVPNMDQPGRYIYIRDMKKNEYWGATWQPTVDIPYDFYECRHGLGYTKITTEYKNIKAETTYLVPHKQHFEIWRLRITNNSKEEKTFRLFTYAEFSFFDSQKDITNVDWCQQIQQATFENNTIFHNDFMKVKDYAFFSSNLTAHSYETSLERFVGKYRGLANPEIVEKGEGANYCKLRGNGVGCICNEITLKPGEEKTVLYYLGTIKDPKEITSLLKEYQTEEQAKSALIEIKKYWDGFIGKLHVKTPDAAVDTMVNIWNQYQCKMTYNWSRFVSLYQLGINRGMGFRDSAQDTLGIMHTIPEAAKNLIIKLLKIQFKDGHAYHLFYPLTGEGDIGEAEDAKGFDWYSDDHLWSVLAVTSYLKETGDMAFLDEIIPYADDQGEGTVLEHLEKAIDFTKHNLGPHKLPLIGWADWNDTLNLDQGKKNAESVWAGHLYAKALKDIIDLYTFLTNDKKISHYQKLYDEILNNINEQAWDGDWYIRAFDDDKQPLGSHTCEKGQIFLNAQTWAVFSGVANTDSRAQKVMDEVFEKLNTEKGIVVMYPSYNGFDWTKGGTTTYPPGAKENGGIFLHTNPWAMIAETILGRGNKAFQYYKQILPSTKNEIADEYEIEPYVYCQNILGKEHPQFGLGRNSWLSGTAAWNMVAISQYILGVRPDYRGLVVDPCITSEWKEFSVTRVFRDVTYSISIKNPDGKEKGISSVTVDGKKIEGNIVPVQERDCSVEVVM